jgi:Flp pilus assembly protein TadB
VPLSEHEQRLLEQIEQALYAEDPKFARSWRVRDLRSLQRARAIRAAVLVLVGLGLLVAGVIVQGSSIVVGVALGVVGFILMLLGAWLALSSRARQSAPKQPKARAPKESLKTRLEERWQRRQDER